MSRKYIILYLKSYEISIMTRYESIFLNSLFNWQLLNNHNEIVLRYLSMAYYMLTFPYRLQMWKPLLQHSVKNVSFLSSFVSMLFVLSRLSWSMIMLFSYGNRFAVTYGKRDGIYDIIVRSATEQISSPYKY